MRSKHYSTLLAILALPLILATSAFAAPPRGHLAHYWAHRSPIGHAYFLPQVMDTHHRGHHIFSWGMLRYNKWGQQFEFGFNGFNLERRQDYTLVYYPGEEAPMICLGQGTSNRMGYINITASADICSLPVAEDPNFSDGARIMLVPSEDAACEEGVLFEPESSNYLVSPQLIQFTDTDGCPVPEPPVTPPAPPAEEGTETTEPESEESEESGESEESEESGESDDSGTVMPY